jgi:ribosomal protein L12E/L44/L45/RPP1/RPP2
VREARCLENTLALIDKYNKNKVVDTKLIHSHWPARPNSWFAKILIFILQFFGRADHLFPQEVVSKLWRALLFVNDFVLALHNQADISRDRSRLKIPAGGVDGMSIDDLCLEACEAVNVKSEKKRKNGPQKNVNKSANKKSRSENTVLEELQYDVSTNHFALFHPF